MTQTGDLVLGTSMWAWSIDKASAFQILDEFYAAGFRRIDAATNYPINKKKEDFRAAEKILHEWIKVNGIHDLEIICKFGSINNLFTPEHNLSKSFTLMSADYYRNYFGSNAHILMIHWDNRDDIEEISQTYEGLKTASEQGWQLGLSGIKYPDKHLSVNQKFNFDFQIEVKHNPLDSGYEHYSPFHSNKPKFLAYGTGGGGIKLQADYNQNSSIVLRDKLKFIKEENIGKLKEIISKSNQNSERPQLTQMHELGMLNALLHPEFCGAILGCSNLPQLQTSLAFYRRLGQYDYQDTYLDLQNL